MPQQPDIQPSQSIQISTLPGLAAKGKWRVDGLRARPCHAFYWITRGQGQITIGAMMRGVGPNSLLFVPAGRVHSLGLRKNTQGYVAFVPETQPVPVSERACLIKAASIFEQGQITGFFEQMSAENNDRGLGVDQAMEAYATLLSVWIERAKARNEWEHNGAKPRSMRLVDAFLTMLEHDLEKNNPVEEYAHSLQITAAHLSRVCQEHLTNPASGVIQARQMLQSRYLLSDGSLKIGEISTKLGFSSPGYFSRFFARHTGFSPREFRINAQKPHRR